MNLLTKLWRRRYWQREVHSTVINSPSTDRYPAFGGIAWLPIEWHRDNRTGYGHERGNCRSDCPYGGAKLVLVLEEPTP